MTSETLPGEGCLGEPIRPYDPDIYEMAVVTLQTVISPHARPITDGFALTFCTAEQFWQHRGMPPGTDELIEDLLELVGAQNIGETIDQNDGSLVTTFAGTLRQHPIYFEERRSLPTAGDRLPAVAMRVFNDQQFKRHQRHRHD